MDDVRRSPNARFGFLGRLLKTVTTKGSLSQTTSEVRPAKFRSPEAYAFSTLRRVGQRNEAYESFQ